MNREGVSKYIPVILVVVIIVIIVAAFISVGRNFFGREEPASDPGQSALVSTGGDRSVRMTVRGPIVAQEEFRSYQITVSPDQRQLVTYQGYLESALETQELDNNSRAYEEFVYGLSRYGMMIGDEGDRESDDIRGRCPTGLLYEFETINAGGVVKRLWATGCRGDRGTLEAEVKPVRNLFRQQIPESREFLSRIDMN